MSFKSLFFISQRYIFSKRGHDLSNILAKISIISLSVIVASAIILISLFNGMGDLVTSALSNFEPDLKIYSENEKHFKIDSNTISNIKKNITDAKINFIVEEDVLVKYGSKQFIVKIRGVEPEYLMNDFIQKSIIRGKEYTRQKKFIVVGLDMAYKLNINYSNYSEKIQLYTPSITASNTIGGQDFKQVHYPPMALYSVDSDIDAKYIFIDRQTALELIQKKENYTTHIEVQVPKNKDAKYLKRKLLRTLPAKYAVKTFEEINGYVFQILKNEKIAIIFVLIILILISSFNVVGSILTLFLEKKKDFLTLRFLGFSEKNLFYIRFFSGSYKFILGAFIGIFLGLGFFFCQKYAPFLILNPNSPEFRKPYPVSINLLDIFFVFICTILIGFIISFLTAKEKKQKPL